MDDDSERRRLDEIRARYSALQAENDELYRAKMRAETDLFNARVGGYIGELVSIREKAFEEARDRLEEWEEAHGWNRARNRLKKQEDERAAALAAHMPAAGSDDDPAVLTQQHQLGYFYFLGSGLSAKRD